MVRAVDVKTIGLGGDSEISLSPDGRMIIGPQRIVPMSLLAAHHSDVMESLFGPSPCRK
jgi:N-methylhydantoinase A/oxoprolinase/acetone carboxylase beta subunit